MRRVRYAVAMSLDGYIAGPKGEADWIVMDPEIDFEAMAREFDTLLMGRRTFEALSRTGGDLRKGPFGRMRIVVVSRALTERDHPDVTIVSGDLQQTVTTLVREAGKDIWLFGGGELFRRLLELDLVDTVEVAVIPIVLGQGIPLLPPPTRRARLTLTDHRVYGGSGIVGLAYDVARERRPGR